MFDTLSYVEVLKKADVPEDQAKAHARALMELVMTDVATKGDLEKMTDKLTIRFGGMLIVAVAALSAVIKLL